ncbi:MAG: glycosyltransferase family 39 protein [Desulfobacterales bacterium]|nr:glycosyltransferase family 39 protein [Desulfobacterales bacterium]
MRSEEPVGPESVFRFFPLKIILTGCLAVLILSVLVLSYVPPVSRDALTHHLAVPKIYLKLGGIHEIPSIIYSYYPMNLDLLYLIALYLGHDIFAKTIHFSFALLTAGLIFAFLNKRLHAGYGLFGALLFLSLPVIVKLSITVYVDLGLVFFSTAALLYFLKWVEKKFTLRYLVVSAFACGLALGTKYNGLIVLFLLTLAAVFFYLRGARDLKFKRIKAAGCGALFMCIALLVFSPWMVRNFIWTKNPVYPMYPKWFQAGAGNHVPDEIDLGNDPPPGHFTIRRLLYKESWPDILLIPLRIFFQGQDENPRYFDGRLNPYLFMFPFFAFWGLKGNPAGMGREKKILLMFSLLYLSFAFFQIDMRIRYIAPVIPPLVILSVYGLREINGLIARRTSRLARGIFSALLGLAVVSLLFLNLHYILQQFKIVAPISYITGQVSRDAYIEKHRHEYPAIQFANQTLAPDAKILALFLGGRTYYSDREMVSNENIFKAAILRAGTPEKVLSNLEKNRITHLLVRYDLFKEWAANNFNGNQAQVLNNFFQDHAALIFFKHGYGLFALSRKFEGSRPK